MGMGQPYPIFVSAQKYVFYFGGGGGGGGGGRGVGWVLFFFFSPQTILFFPLIITSFP